LPPNGLGFSGGAPRDQESIRADPSVLLNRKIAPIQPLRCNGLFGGGSY
jgi:hypothetical protein